MSLLLLPRYLMAGGLLMAAEASQAQTPGTGLLATYYEGRNFEQVALTRTDPTIDFNWTYGPLINGRSSGHFVSPGPGVSAENFSVRWTGYLYAPVTGTYTLHITTDDGMRLWLGGRLVLNEWRDQWVTTYSTRVQLRAGRYYALRVEYYQTHYDTRALLAWQTPPLTAPSWWDKVSKAVGFGDAEPEPIPTRYLYPALPTTVQPRVIPTPPLAKATATPTVPAATPVAPAASTRRTKPVTAARPATVRPLVALSPKVTAADTTLLASTLPTLGTLAKGETLTLPNLYFTRSTAALLPTSYPTLNALARTLEQQPALRLAIAGHTDNVGDVALNQHLSEQRARVVRRYLVQQGIDSLRLTAVGYGGTRPVANNSDPRQRPRNRRVEVVVE